MHGRRASDGCERGGEPRKPIPYALAGAGVRIGQVEASKNIEKMRCMKRY